MTRVYLFAVLSLFVAPLSRATTVFDGFEGSSLSPFWSVTGPGSATLTNTIAFQGSQSVLLSTSPTFPWSVTLSHDFGSEQAGSASVYVANEICCSAADIQVFESDGDWVNIQYNSLTGTFQSRVSIGGVQSGVFFAGSSEVWHFFQIDAGTGGVTVELDGHTVFTNPSITGFRSVALDVWGAPTGSANFDNFTATTTPEPATAFQVAGTLLLLIGGEAALRRLRPRGPVA